jgi:excisionase family DNA binding protein
MMTAMDSADMDMDSPDMSGDWVTTEEAAELAGVSARTVRRWIESGRLAAVESDQGRLVSATTVAQLGQQRGSPSRTQARPEPVTDTDLAGHDRPAIPDQGAVIAELERSIARLESERDRWHEAFAEEQSQVRAFQVLLAKEQDQSRQLRAVLEETERRLEALTASDDDDHQEQAPTASETALDAPEHPFVGDQTSAGEAGLARLWEWLRRH